MGHKPWDRAWKRAAKAREKRRWRREMWWDGQVVGTHLLPRVNADPDVLPPSAAITAPLNRSEVMRMREEGQDAPRRWSHCANGLRSHVPQPGSDRWWSTGREGEPDCWCAVCDECGYYVWLTPDWEKYPSCTTTEPQLEAPR